jgi:hypothetical protein
MLPADQKFTNQSRLVAEALPFPTNPRHCAACVLVNIDQLHRHISLDSEGQRKLWPVFSAISV